MKNRRRKLRLYAKVQEFKRKRRWMTEEEYIWEFMPPVGREFGSPEYKLKQFTAMLDKPLTSNPGLERLMSVLPPWRSNKT